jgi:hypothetical protein
MTLAPSRPSCDLALGDAYAAARHSAHATVAPGDFFSVNCGREQSVPAEGYAVLRGSPVCALSEAYGLQRLPRSMSSARLSAPVRRIAGDLEDPGVFLRRAAAPGELSLPTLTCRRVSR